MRNKHTHIPSIGGNVKQSECSHTATGVSVAKTALENQLATSTNVEYTQ